MYTITEDTSFQNTDPRVVCSNMHQTFAEALAAEGEIEQWLRFSLHAVSTRGILCTVWATREAAIGVQPTALVELLCGIPPRDMDSPEVRAELALWPGLLGLYTCSINPPCAVTMRLNESPLQGGVNKDIAGYEVTGVFQEVPSDWAGCLWHYGELIQGSSTNNIVDNIVGILQAHCGPGKSLDGIEQVIRGSGLNSIGPPRLEVQADTSTIEQNALINGDNTIWTGEVGITVTLLITQTGSWWREAVYFLSAIRSILADEFASGISGVWRMVLDGGQNPRAGAGSIHFIAVVQGSFEIVAC
jgi:hypothetical protein